MAELPAASASRGIPYWLELPHNPREHTPRLAELGRRAAAVVSDLFPTFIIPGHLRGAAKALGVPLFAVDASCVVPMQRIPSAQVGAYALRPKLKKLWPEYRDRLLGKRPVKAASAAKRLSPGFPTADARAQLKALASFDIDHSVPPVEGVRSGRSAALRALRGFVEQRLGGFDTGRGDPGRDGQSGLSPYFHWGHLFAGEAARAAIDAHGEDHPGVREFLEDLLVRRELGFNYCFHTPGPQQLSVASLPGWARATLDAHRGDAREHLYSLEDLDAARTGDGLWNASQRELRERGRIHNYLRMLWGKRILEWSPTPEEALARMAWLNDRYALDGRDPASVANFQWVLGLHDRPFQERKVIGKVRPMSSARTAEKFDLRPYLARWARPGDAEVKVPRGRGAPRR
jgi:deoxyribodipyrimidine photo-lyase